MFLIVGLGNPGVKYVKTRHNIGFQVIESFQKENQFPDFKIKRRFQAAISEGTINNEKIILVKPQTFMNNSGQAVKSLSTNYQLPTTNLIVVHDDLDLPLGKIRICQNRGSAGHKGVESIIQEIGTKNFIRFRIGIEENTSQPDNGLKVKTKILEKFVLENFTQEEKKIIKGVITRTCQALHLVITQGIEKVMTEFNKQ